MKRLENCGVVVLFVLAGVWLTVSYHRVNQAQAANLKTIPVLSAVLPKCIWATSPQQLLTLSGANFTKQATLIVDDTTSLKPTFVDSQTLQVKSPDNSFMPHVYKLQVSQQGKLSGVAYFQVAEPLHWVTATLPDGRVGESYYVQPIGAGGCPKE